MLKRTLTNVPPPKDQGNGYGDARDTVRGINPDTITVNYKGVDYTLMFTQGWQEDSMYATTVYQVTSHSPLLKTPAGIGIGDELPKITNVYYGSSIDIEPGYDDKSRNGEPVKGKSEVTVMAGSNGNTFTFYIINNKVEAMEVTARREGD
jgi:hypothetical protein